MEEFKDLKSVIQSLLVENDKLHAEVARLKDKIENKDKKEAERNKNIYSFINNKKNEMEKMFGNNYIWLEDTYTKTAIQKKICNEICTYISVINEDIYNTGNEFINNVKYLENQILVLHTFSLNLQLDPKFIAFIYNFRSELVSKRKK